MSNLLKLTEKGKDNQLKKMVLYYDNKASIDYLMGELTKESIITHLETKELEELYGDALKTDLTVHDLIQKYDGQSQISHGQSTIIG